MNTYMKKTKQIIIQQINYWHILKNMFLFAFRQFNTETKGRNSKDILSLPTIINIHINVDL